MKFCPVTQEDEEESEEDIDEPLTEAVVSRDAYGRPVLNRDHLLNYSADDGVDKSFSNFDADIWGVTIFTIIRDLTKIVTCDYKSVQPKVVLIRGAFGILLWAVNLWLQLGTLYYVQLFVVKTSVASTQENYAQYHREVFGKDATLSQAAWDTWGGPKTDLCNLAISKQWFTYLILFIWTSRIIQEARDATRLMKDITRVQPLPSDALPTDMLQKVDVDGQSEWHLVALNCTARTLIWALVIIPKLFVALVVLYVGSEWLCATQSFADLILNALALSFVIDIDEQLFDAFAPEILKGWVDNTKYCHIRLGSLEGGETAFKGDDLEVAQLMGAYGRSILFVICCFVWAYVYLKYLQQVIPSYDHDIETHCASVFREALDLTCPPFSFQPLAQCFPYGT